MSNGPSCGVRGASDKIGIGHELEINLWLFFYVKFLAGFQFPGSQDKQIP